MGKGHTDDHAVHSCLAHSESFFMHYCPVVFVRVPKLLDIKTRNAKGTPHFILNVSLKVRILFQNWPLPLWQAVIWKTDP